MTENKTPVHPDLYELEYECDDLGVTLTCFFEYEPAERGSREYGTGLQLEPDYPETLTLMHVYLPGSNVDIAPVMLLSLIDEIEGWAADEMEKDRQSDIADAAYDRWMDEQLYGRGD